LFFLLSLNYPRRLQVLDFTATWCGPCKQISPIFEKAAEENTNVDFRKVDIDNSPDVAQEFGISSVFAFHLFEGSKGSADFTPYRPTFIFLKGSEIVHKFSGANPPCVRDLHICEYFNQFSYRALKSGIAKLLAGSGAFSDDFLSSVPSQCVKQNDRQHSKPGPVCAAYTFLLATVEFKEA